jgi:hypothetical protein
VLNVRNSLLDSLYRVSFDQSIDEMFFDIHLLVWHEAPWLQLVLMILDQNNYQVAVSNSQITRNLLAPDQENKVDVESLTLLVLEDTF